jgi:hypothetical protein
MTGFTNVVQQFRFYSQRLMKVGDTINEGCPPLTSPRKLGKSKTEKINSSKTAKNCMSGFKS